MNSQKERDDSKPVCIVLDTNIWVYKTDLLRTPLGSALTHALLQVEGHLGLPSIIEEEIIKHVVRRGGELAAEILEKASKVAHLLGQVDERLMAVPTDDEFEKSAKEKLRELDDLLLRVPFTFEHAKSALRRVMDETPPNGRNNQQYKDSAIWEAVLELSHTHTVHFVTEDKGFFTDRTPSKGLASNLKEDRDAMGGKIIVHYGVRSCLDALEEDVPPLDYQGMAFVIDHAIVEDLRDIAADKEFGLGKVVDWNISAFRTEKLGILALSFELVYKAFDVSPLRDEEETEATLIVKGECSFDLRDQAASDVRKESVRLLDAQGSLIPGKAVSYVYGGGIAMGGERLRRRPYELRIPLDEPDES
jgi:predicted nucleic acid-binding protein